MTQDRNIKFSKDLKDFLIKELGEESEEICRWASSSLIYQSINVLYQNCPCPNKENFFKLYEELSKHLLTKYVEGIK